MVIICVILHPLLGSWAKEFSLLLTLAGVAMVGMCALGYIEPVLDFLRELDGNGGFLEAVARGVGVAVAAEVIAMLCADSGCGALGKAVQTLGNGVILYLSIPIFSGLMEVIREILGQL